MEHRINRFWEKPKKRTMWQKVGLSKQKRQAGLLGDVFHKKQKKTIINFRLFGSVLLVLFVLAGGFMLVGKFLSGNSKNLFLAFSDNAPQAPMEARFTDDCGHPYYPLFADSETVFGRVVNNDIVDQFYLVTAERSGNDYLQNLEVDEKVYSLPITCSDGRIQPWAYVDWSGVFGEPLKTLETRQVSGLQLPVDFSAGSRWLTEFILNGKDLPTDHTYGAVSVVVTDDNQSFIPETLTTPAGQMNVLRVLVNEKICFLDSEGVETHPAKEQKYYEYWAQGKGLVRIHAEKVRDWDYVIINQGFRAN